MATYITIKQSKKFHQITLDEILVGPIDVRTLLQKSKETNATITHKTDYINRKFVNQFDIVGMVECLEKFNNDTEELRNTGVEKQYNTFFIPKKSGGVRRIDEPNKELKDALYILKHIFEDVFFALHHTTAFAYIKNRSTIDAVKKHQANESKWFGKFDFSNFFGSTTQDFLTNMLSIIFPFSEVVKYERGRDALNTALSICFLNGGLPQGTPISPMLTNLMMIPIDHEISKKLREYKDNKFVYTRYADDLLISSKKDFPIKDVEKIIIETLKEFDAPFSLNIKKTRYGSSAGRNWNLGLMLNKDNEITIGYKKKKQFKAMLNNYICDKKSGVNWDIHDVQVLSGLISYYKMIEEKYIDYIIHHYDDKYRVDLRKMIHDDICV